MRRILPYPILSAGLFAASVLLSNSVAPPSLVLALLIAILAPAIMLALRVERVRVKNPRAIFSLAIDIAIEQGLPVLNFSFHSPSLQPGNTPYVRSNADLALFYRWWDIILDHLARRGVEATTAAQIVAMAERGTARTPAA